MSQRSAEILERLLVDNGLDIGPAEFKDRLLLAQIETLNLVTETYRTHLPDQAPVLFSPETLADESAKNPHKVRAFLQAFTSPCSTLMIVMAWRILQGLKIRKVDMKYEEEKEFSLTVVLSRPGDGQVDPEYVSHEIWDFDLLKHFKKCTLNKKPVLLGFSPLRLKNVPAKAEAPGAYIPLK